jgi:hypothetical protein
MSRAASYYGYSWTYTNPLWQSNSSSLANQNDIILLATGESQDGVNTLNDPVLPITDKINPWQTKAEKRPLKLGDVIHLYTPNKAKGLVEIYADYVFVVTEIKMEDVRPRWTGFGEANRTKLTVEKAITQLAAEKVAKKAEVLAYPTSKSIPRLAKSVTGKFGIVNHVEISIKVTPVKSVKLISRELKEGGQIIEPRMLPDGHTFVYNEGITKESSGEVDLLTYMQQHDTSAIYRVTVTTRTENNIGSTVANVFGQEWGGKKSRKSKKPKSKKGGKKNKTYRKSSKRSKK